MCVCWARAFDVESSQFPTTATLCDCARGREVSLCPTPVPFRSLCSRWKLNTRMRGFVGFSNAMLPHMPDTGLSLDLDARYSICTTCKGYTGYAERA